MAFLGVAYRAFPASSSFHEMQSSPSGTKSYLVGIEIERASLQVRGFRVRSFDCGTGSQSHHGARYPTPPYNAGRSDFPSPV